jgi:hypothetical protein
MIVKYTWPQRTNDPREIVSVELPSFAVPRIGESVELNVPITDDEAAVHCGIVKRVDWSYRHDGQQVRVSLS